MVGTTLTKPTGFDAFELDEALVRGIGAAGYRSPRTIQTDTIPAALAGRDVLGLAQTGTGKTAAFALPLLNRLLEGNAGTPRALVLAPTRELATQIAAEIRTLAKFTRVKAMTAFGGVSVRTQVTALRERPEIVVGCPGRILDLLQQGVLRLGRIEVLVIDEADHMFDMGFLRDVRKILAALPARRQNLLFSATMPTEIRRFAADLLQRPLVVELANQGPVATIDHALYPVAEDRKRDLLAHLLAQDACSSAIVFMRTKQRARRLAEFLNDNGHRAVGLQGNMSQGQRDRAMIGFRSRRFDILVATDIAARGIDVRGVSHVINFDVPNTPEAYTHRIGRTGRAELEGVACTFITGQDRDWVRATERMIGAAIPRRELPDFASREIGSSTGAGKTQIEPPKRGNAKWVDARTTRSRNGRKSSNGPRRSRRSSKPSA